MNWFVNEVENEDEEEEDEDINDQKWNNKNQS